MTISTEAIGLGLGIDEQAQKQVQQTRLAGRQAIIKPPSWGPVARKPSHSTPFSHHRSPSWIMPAEEAETVRINTMENNNNNSPLDKSFQFPPHSERQKELKKLSQQIFGCNLEGDESPSGSSFAFSSSEEDFEGGMENGLKEQKRGKSTDSFTSTLSLRCHTDGEKGAKGEEKMIHQRQQNGSPNQTSNVSAKVELFQGYSMVQNQNTIRNLKRTPLPLRRPALNPLFNPEMDKQHSREASSSSSSSSSATSSSVQSIIHSMETKKTLNEEQQIQPQNLTLALLMAKEGRDIRIEANGRSLEEIERLVTSKTTHLILSNCRFERNGVQESLERILKICSSSLLVLDIENCQLQELPQALTQCRKLEELNVSSNHFLHSWNSEMDSQTKFCQTLQVLIMDNCGLTILPGILMHFPFLKSLSARKNHLTHLPSWLHHLHNLERLSIGGNPFIGPWIDICLPFTMATISSGSSSTSTTPSKPKRSSARPIRHHSRTPSSSTSSSSTRMTTEENFSGGDHKPRTRVRSLSNSVLPVRSSSRQGAGTMKERSTPKEEQQEEVEELQDGNKGSYSNEIYSSSASPYLASTAKFRPSMQATMSANDVRMVGLSDSDPSSNSTTPNSDLSPITPISPFSLSSPPPLSNRKNSQSDLDTTGRWATFKRKLSRKASTPTLEIDQKVSSSINSNSTKKSFPQTLRRPQTSSGNVSTFSERSSSLSDEYHQTANPTTNHLTNQEKRIRRTSFLPFALPIDPNNSSKMDEQDDPDLQQRRNVLILLRYLEDLSQLNPNQRLLNENLTRPRMFSCCSELSNFTMKPRSVGEGSENTFTTSPTSSRPSTDDEGCTVSPSTSIGDISSPINLSPILMTVKDDAIRRANIIQEIIATEETYVKGLKELIDIYIVPSSKSEGTQQQFVIPITERRLVFVNIEAILHFHKEAFLPSLQFAAKSLLERKGERPNQDENEKMQEFNQITIKVAEKVAETFERHIAFFRMYTAYVNNVENGQNRVASWLNLPLPGGSVGGGGPILRSGHSMSNLRRESSNPMTMMKSSIESPTSQQQQQQDASLSVKDRKRIRQFLQKARLDPRHSQLSLEAYLHLPVQRIPRYKLLLTELVKYCPMEKLQDSHSITNALQSVISIATMMNESKRQSEMDKRLLQWQEKINGNFPSPLVQPHRRLMKDGEIVLTRIVTRIPSFTAKKGTILGDSSMYDPMDDHVHLQIADAESFPTSIIGHFRSPSTHLLQQHSPDSFLQNSLPPPLPPKEDHLQEELVQVYHLEQKFVQTNVQVIVCSDITVILESSSSNDSLELFSVMRIENEPKLIQHQNQSLLRICDSEKVYYLQAKDKEDAESWLKAFSLANTRRPSI